jgi:hypothetical protein
VQRLGGSEGCRRAIKNQLAEIDSLDVTVQAVHVNGAAHTATAQVKSTRSGKSQPGALLLVREGGKWKVSGEQ